MGGAFKGATMFARLYTAPSHVDDVDALCSRIKRFANLPLGWDGEDAAPPSLGVLDAACKLVREMPREADLPAVAPGHDGEIGLTWINGPKQLNAMLHTDFHLVWVKRYEPGGHFLRGDEIDLSVERYPHAFAEEVATLYR
jgi:hypothetical protein